MTVPLRITFLERAIAELRLELSEIEARFSGDMGPTRPDVPGGAALLGVSYFKEQHADISTVLQEQRSALTKILSDALREREALKRGSSP